MMRLRVGPCPSCKQPRPIYAVLIGEKRMELCVICSVRKRAQDQKEARDAK